MSLSIISFFKDERVAYIPSNFFGSSAEEVAVTGFFRDGDWLIIDYSIKC